MASGHKGSLVGGLGIVVWEIVRGRVSCRLSDDLESVQFLTVGLCVCFKHNCRETGKGLEAPSRFGQKPAVRVLVNLCRERIQ